MNSPIRAAKLLISNLKNKQKPKQNKTIPAQRKMQNVMSSFQSHVNHSRWTSSFYFSYFINFCKLNCKNIAAPLLRITVRNFMRLGANFAQFHASSLTSRCSIEGLHDAVCTYTRTILPCSLLSFCVVRYREKQQKTLELLIYLTERFKIFTECVSWYSCHSAIIWYYGMN